MTRHCLALLIGLTLAACTHVPTAPSLGSDNPSVIRLTGNDSRVDLSVAISALSLSRAPLRIEFFGNYPWRDTEGNVKQPTDPHVLTRNELGGISTNDNGVQLEAYVNQIWLPRELRNADGQITDFGCIDILLFTPQDVNWTLTISVNPIPYLNNTCQA